MGARQSVPMPTHRAFRRVPSGFSRTSHHFGSKRTQDNFLLLWSHCQLLDFGHPSFATYQRHPLGHCNNDRIPLIYIVFSGRPRGGSASSSKYLDCASNRQTDTYQKGSLRARGIGNGRLHAPVLPALGSMTTFLPGINFPSTSATSIIRLAILSFTDPPEDIYSSFATIPKERHPKKPRGHDPMRRMNVRRLHFNPASLAILSSRTRGV